MIAGLIQILALVLVLVILWYVAKLVVTHFAPSVGGLILQIIGLIFALIVVMALLRLAGVPLPFG
jgi:hypothetical protein